MRLRDLNRLLDGKGLALSQMGGYDAQTVAGVMSTATHGSGIEFGPIADSVRSLDLVASGGRLIRIEREDGPTDPAPSRGELRKDDDVFNAAVVGMGCLGVIYAAAIAVEPEYWLTEVRELSTWSQERERIPDALARQPPLRGLPQPLSGRRRRAPLHRLPPQPHHRSPAQARERPVAPPLVARARKSLEGDPLPRQPRARRAARHRAAAAPTSCSASCADNEYTGPSYKVLNIGAANLLPAYSSELAVPLDRYAEAIDRLIEVAARHRELGRVYHTASSPCASSRPRPPTCR